MEYYDQEFAREVGKRIAAMTPTEIKAWSQLPVEKQPLALTVAFAASDRVVCHTCQTVTTHKVSVDEQTKIVFTCDICGDEVSGEGVDIAIQTDDPDEPYISHDEEYGGPIDDGTDPDISDQWSEWARMNS